MSRHMGAVSNQVVGENVSVGTRRMTADEALEIWFGLCRFWEIFGNGSKLMLSVANFAATDGELVGFADRDVEIRDGILIYPDVRGGRPRENPVGMFVIELANGELEKFISELEKDEGIRVETVPSREN